MKNFELFKNYVLGTLDHVGQHVLKLTCDKNSSYFKCLRKEICVIRQGRYWLGEKWNLVIKSWTTFIRSIKGQKISPSVDNKRPLQHGSGSYQQEHFRQSQEKFTYSYHSRESSQPKETQQQNGIYRSGNIPWWSLYGSNKSQLQKISFGYI